MNEQQLKRALHELAQEHVPDDTDIWQSVQSQVKPKRRFHARLIPSFTRAMAAMIAIFTVSTVAYAVFQMNYCDPALCEAYDLITELNLSETIDGVTVTLDWAYVDAHRVALQFTGVYEGSDEPISLSQDYSLTDAEGRAYMPMFGGGGGGGGSPDGDAPPIITFNSGVSFAVPEMDTVPETLTLRLEVTLTDASIVPPSEPAGRGGSSGGGGGGGGAMPPQHNPPTPTPSDEETGTGGAGHISTMGQNPPTEVGSGGAGNSQFVAQQPTPPIGPFVFEFTLPFVPALILDDVQLMTVNDVTVLLEQVAITPSLTRADLCFDVPDSTESWQPRITLSDGDMTLSSQGMEITDPTEATCYRASFLMPYTPDEAIDWTLTIPRLVGPPNHTSEQIVAGLQERGIDAEVFPGGGFGVSNAPPDVDIGQVIMEIEDFYRDTIEGPWIFTIQSG